MMVVHDQRVESRKIFFYNNTSIDRFVVSEAILKWLRLIDYCMVDDSVLYGCNTDGVYVADGVQCHSRE